MTKKHSAKTVLIYTFKLIKSYYYDMSDRNIDNEDLNCKREIFIEILLKTFTDNQKLVLNVIENDIKTRLSFYSSTGRSGKGLRHGFKPLDIYISLQNLATLLGIDKNNLLATDNQFHVLYKIEKSLLGYIRLTNGAVNEAYDAFNAYIKEIRLNYYIMKKQGKKNTSSQSIHNYPAGKNRITIPMELRFSDMDANGHLFFGNYFTLFDSAFLEYLNIIGYSFDMFCEKQLNFYYVEATSQYKAPVKYGEALNITVWIENIGRTSFTIKFEAFNQTYGHIAANGLIVAVVVNQKTEKPTQLPEDFKKAIERKG